MALSRQREPDRRITRPYRGLTGSGGLAWLYAPPKAVTTALACGALKLAHRHAVDPELEYFRWATGNGGDA